MIISSFHLLKFIVLVCVGIFLSPIFCFSQVFWFEDFENGCVSDCSADGYTGVNGTWVVTSSGTNDADNNMWYVSCSESGEPVGSCGTGCSPPPKDGSLHVGFNVTSLGDIGAAYMNGGGGFWFVVTNLRAESPTIDCSGRDNISLSFNYIEGGQSSTDDATLWYFDGVTWSLLDSLAKPPLGTCAPQGLWTAFSIILPSSADNNPNVKIGFNWTNNDDGIGVDPSIAIDDIELIITGLNLITGTVFDDENANCFIDSSDYRLPGWMIKVDPGPIYGYTDYLGNYKLYLDSGNYIVSLINNDPLRDQVCPSSPSFYTLSLDTIPDTISNIDFSVQANVYCPNLSVDISTWGIRPCRTSIYSVSYCNYGTLAATSVTIEVELDSNMSYSGGSGNLISQNGNVFTFDTGTLNPMQCGYFNFNADVTCNNSLMGSTICVEAHIYPDSSCFPPDSAWDKSSVAVEGACINDSLACFTIYNTGDPGNGDMVGISEYRIYENNLLVNASTFQLIGWG